MRGVEKLSSSNPAVDEPSRVIIYLEGYGLMPGAPTIATFTEKNRRFDPKIVVVPTGSTVSFPNGDPIFHNVFSLSKAGCCHTREASVKLCARHTTSEGCRDSVRGGMRDFGNRTSGPVDELTFNGLTLTQLR